MKKLLIYITIVLGFVSCESLDVPNPNNPDRENLLANTHDLNNFAQNIYVKYWQATHDLGTTSNPHISALVAADQFTASWGNFACRYISNEPRQIWDNSINADDNDITEDFYAQIYNVLYMSNTELKLIHDGSKISSDSNYVQGVVAYCYFMQGVALGQLGLVFNKAQIVDENTEIKNLTFSDYHDVTSAAIAALNKAIKISDSITFNLGTEIVKDVTLDNVLLSRISHAYAARFMVESARNKTDNLSTDWAQVLVHTQKGITQDFGPTADGSVRSKWYDDNAYFLSNTDISDIFYVKVDCRIINMLDPAYPAHYPANGRAPRVHAEKHPGEALSDDARLASDFEFSSTVRFIADRGKYHFSHYRYKRFDNLRLKNTGAMLDFPRYELVMYAAEARVMLGQNDKALAILNFPSFPRVARGELGVLPAESDKKTLLNTIFYEREIELLGQGFMIGFCDMRRRDLLQKGTPLHFPVPGQELQTLGLTNYTFGGEQNSDGVNTSNAGW